MTIVVVVSPIYISWKSSHVTFSLTAPPTFLQKLVLSSHGFHVSCSQSASNHMYVKHQQFYFLTMHSLTHLQHSKNVPWPFDTYLYFILLLKILKVKTTAQLLLWKLNYGDYCQQSIEIMDKMPESSSRKNKGPNKLLKNILFNCASRKLSSKT